MEIEITVLKTFDIGNKTLVKVGSSVMIEINRAQHLIAGGYAEAVKKKIAKKKPAK